MSIKNILILLILVRTAQCQEYTYLPVNQKVYPNSRVATDVISHTQRFTQYDDVVTVAHEMTHDVQADLKNLTREQDECLYLLNDKCFRVMYPRGIKLSQILQRLPYRPPATQTYLIDADAYYADYPTYVLNEWQAYMNGCSAGIEAGLTDRTEYSFQRACQLGLFSCILRDLSQQNDISDYINLGYTRMLGLKKNIQLKTNLHWDAFEKAYGKTQSRIEPN